MPKILKCQICWTCPAKYIIRNEVWAILKICPLCLEDFRENGIEPIIVETLPTYPKDEDWRGKGIL